MAVPGYRIKNNRTLLERAEKFISPLYFTDANLYGRLYPQTQPVKSLSCWRTNERVTYKEAEKQQYKPTAVGETFGPIWSTVWFKVDIEIPDSWEGHQVHFCWDSGSEALLWKNGEPIQGFTDENRRTDYTITKSHKKNQKKHVLMVEMACNGLFGCGLNGQIQPPDPNKTFTLSKAQITIFDQSVYDLLMDFEVIIDLVRHVQPECNRFYQGLSVLNEMVNCIDVKNQETYKSARKLAKEFLTQKNGDSQHVVHVIGNCHIDTAWLWTYAETRRKCARSWSSTVRLLEEYPNWTFAGSQAQQFEWVKENYPVLYEQIRKFAKQGRFLPVGGTWVEMDGNIPSGEAFVRQFLYGQRFFKEEFGSYCKEFWLPDTFGYSAQLPQIMSHCGIKRFVTQKISWNLVNKFPHHTFWWEGIDGTKSLVHFPPGDNYGMKGKVEELMKTIDNFKDKGRSNQSLYLFGYGDGGQGPTAEMLERLTRLQDVDGCPRVEMSNSHKFFDALEASATENLCRWTGELYLELHNATYTTQAQTKLKNRKCEFLLRDLEFYSSLALVLNKQPYPSTELLRLWKLLLLNQFHDVLPGSSIEQVYVDAMEHYKDIENSANKLLMDAQGVCISVKKDKTVHSVVYNSFSWDRQEVVAIPTPGGTTNSHAKRKKEVDGQIDRNGSTLVFASAPSCGVALVDSSVQVKHPVSIRKEKNGSICLENHLIKAVFDSSGRLLELYSSQSDRNAIEADCQGNQFITFEDIPLYWDAWDVMDYHLQNRKPVEKVLKAAHIVEDGPLRATFQVSLEISCNSTVHQFVTLDAHSPFVKFDTEVSWHESHQFLKVEFPLSVRTPSATYEIQFGHLKRPTHFNTSWDWAKFEVCGHKWADMSEYGLGVAILNDCKYGWSAIDNVLRLSLLRSSKAPDANADMGTHHFAYAIMPHKGCLQEAGVPQQSYNFNCPLVVKACTGTPQQFSAVSVDNPAIIMEALKAAEGDSNALVMRLYEAFGSHTKAIVKLGFPVKSIHSCNGLEVVHGKPLEVTNNSLTLQFSPFKLISLLVKF